MRQLLTHLQRELRKTMGKKALLVLDAMDGQAALIPAEVAKRAKLPVPSVKTVLVKLKKRGLVRRSGWRDLPGARWPAPEFQLVSARETLNGAGAKTA